MNDEDWVKLNTKYDVFGYTDARGIIAYDVLLPLIEKAEKWDKISEAMKKTIMDIRNQKKPANGSQLVVHHILTAYLQAVDEDILQSSDFTTKDDKEVEG